MTDEGPAPRFTRENAGRGGGSPLAWMLPIALTALVIALAWRLYELGPHDVRDVNAQTRPVVARGDLAADEKSTIELFRAASPAVVQVTNYQRGTDWTGTNEFEIPQGTGSGFVWDPKGYIVTNFHVVQHGNAFAVTFANHDVFEAEPVGQGDPVHDLAVLKIDPKGKSLPALPIGNSRDLLVGQKTFAIGNPFGLDQTLTTGIVSGLDREINSVLGTTIRGVVQTDAAINPGNSGGPLLDSAGRVIGMNTQIASPSGASAGVGFAIPVDIINKIVPQIIRTGHAERAGLGIADLHVYNKDGRRGLVFGEFATSSAARAAGLRPTLVTSDGVRIRSMGDVIVGVDGKRVGTWAEMVGILDAHEIGQEVAVEYLREGKEHTAKVRLVGVQ